MQQMRARVVPHRRLSQFGINDRVDLVADYDRLPRRNRMRPHSLDRVMHALHIGDDRVAVGRIEPALVANLSARFGVERRMVENDFALFTRLEFLRALAALDDRQYLAIIRLRLPITLEDALR